MSFEYTAAVAAMKNAQEARPSNTIEKATPHVRENLQSFLTPKRIAQIGSLVLRKQMTEREGEIFLELFGSQLEDRLGDTVREFVKSKLQASA